MSITLTAVLVVFFFINMVLNFIDAIRYIITEEDVKLPWKVQVISDLIDFIVALLILVWMKFEGWW